MILTPAQKVTLKTNILANPDTLAFYNVGNLQGLADLYNALAIPNFTVWKTNVSLTEVGDNMNGTEFAGLTSLNVTRLQGIADYSANGINPSLTDRRQFFDDIFSGAGGTITRGKLLILWKRLATRLEKLFATGTGSDASPAILVVEGKIEYTEFIGI